MFSFFNYGQKKTNERYFSWEEFTKNFGKKNGFCGRRF